MEEKLICGHKDTKNPLEPCKPGYPCYINSPEHYNCFLVYKNYIDHQHTLQEVAELLNLSHTTVKAIEDQALNKLRKKKRMNDKEIQIIVRDLLNK